MVLNFRGVSMTPDGVYDVIPEPDRYPRGVTDINQQNRVVRDHNVPVHFRKFENAAQALDNLRANIDAGNPMIVLVKYKHWKQATGHNYDDGHFVVATGYDDTNVYMHDPVLSQHTRVGAHFALSHDLFCKGWGGFIDVNLHWQCSIIGEQAAVPQPAAVTPPPAPEPTPSSVSPVVPAAPPPPSRVMEDVNRRIRALAAYRRAEPPDFNNPDAVQLWLDHLGDWGLGYDIYTVKAGDTLSVLAGRFYGEQSRWYAIKAYNDLSQDGSIWIGQTLLIPQLGQSGAQTDPALPSNSADFGKAIELADLVDPDLPANDYNMVWDDSIELAFGEIALEMIAAQ
jgi:hypothetical protein